MFQAECGGGFSVSLLFIRVTEQTTLLGHCHGQVPKEQRQAFLTWKAPLPLVHFLHPGWALGLFFFFKYYSHFLAREAACRSGQYRDRDRSSSVPSRSLSDGFGGCHLHSSSFVGSSGHGNGMSPVTSPEAPSTQMLLLLGAQGSHFPISAKLTVCRLFPGVSYGTYMFTWSALIQLLDKQVNKHSPTLIPPHPSGSASLS